MTHQQIRAILQSVYVLLDSIESDSDWEQIKLQNFSAHSDLQSAAFYTKEVLCKIIPPKVKTPEQLAAEKRSEARRIAYKEERGER